ncbi:MAG: sigma 54-interacting transcriptional regulator [Bacillus sp. (in: Bacteria)]|nr:sigma 54-interacting transcriptional regulator [Bacillus sp. (in: firmicutes)]
MGNDWNEHLLSIYEQLLEKMDLGIHAIDRDGKTIIYNPKMMEIEGMNIEDVLDKNLLDIFQFSDNEESTLLKVLKTGESILNVKQTYFNYKGQEITTINNTYPIVVDGETVGAVEFARDVTKLEKILRENMFVKGTPKYTFDQIIGTSPSLLEVIETSKRATRTTSSVLIVGETGTGKELFAQSIHNGSPRAHRPFVSQNCAAFPAQLLEEILFGTTENAYPGAVDRPGLFEQAEGGTVLLDEIHALHPSLQTKLLRVLQEKTVRRIGDTTDRIVNVRIIATMNEDPIDAISAQKLRKDLYYRLSVVTLFLPPLRERKTDIPALIQCFINKYNQLFSLDVKGVSDDVLQLFDEYDWPGNVRELEHVIEGAMNIIEHEQTIEYQHLPLHFRQKSHRQDQTFSTQLLIQSHRDIKPLDEYMQEAETYYLQKALQYHQYNITKTAEALGMSRQNLQYRIRKYNIERPKS